MPGTPPLVSIITPTYNHEAYIVDCIRSVQAQTYPHWEMLIVNDGSTDATAEQVRACAVDESRVKLFDRKHRGIFALGENYNFALARASGKYVAILEGDDLWEPDKLERQVQALEQNKGAVLAWGKAHAMRYDLGERYGTYPEFESPYFRNDPPGYILNLIYLENRLPALTILIRRSALEQVGGFIQRFGLPLVDLPTLVELSTLGTFHYDEAVLGTWRMYAGQVTKRFTVDIIQGRYRQALDHYRRLSPEVRSRLEISEEDIHAHFNSVLLIAYARSGRYKLMRKEFASARSDYRKAMFYKGLKHPVWRLRALAGYGLSLVGMDVEGLARLLGRKTYK